MTREENGAILRMLSYFDVSACGKVVGTVIELHQQKLYKFRYKGQLTQQRRSAASSQQPIFSPLFDHLDYSFFLPHPNTAPCVSLYSRGHVSLQDAPCLPETS